MTGAVKPVNLKLSVNDTTSWVSVTGTDLEGGATLSPWKENQKCQPLFHQELSTYWCGSRCDNYNR